MGTSTVSTRLDETIIKQLEEIYQKPGTGASVAAEAYVFIRRHTLRELKGMFSREELIGMISNLNGTMQQAESQTNPVMFTAHLEDGEIYDALSLQYKFDFEILIQKVRKLTAAQVFFLQEEIRLFWENEGRDMEKFIERFAENARQSKLREMLRRCNEKNTEGIICTHLYEGPAPYRYTYAGSKEEILLLIEPNHEDCYTIEDDLTIEDCRLLFPKM
jgi:hypothetical protein